MATTVSPISKIAPSSAGDATAEVIRKRVSRGLMSMRRQLVRSQR